MKKRINNLLCFTFCFSLIIAISSTSCNNVVKQNKVVTNKVDPSSIGNQKSYNDSIFTADTSIFFKNYSLKVQSTMQNSRIESTDSNFFNPIVLKQQIFFCYNGKVIKEVDYPVNKIRLKITNGKSIEIQENVLVNIGIAEGTNGSLYVLKGNGGCNSCTEFIGLFSLEGELLWYSYATTRNVFGSFGDSKKVLDKYNIPESIVFSNMKYKNITVYKNNFIPAK
jgi:hypothetical protein